MIYLDMDGVLCDFVGAACSIHGKEYCGTGYDFWRYWNMSAEEFWEPINKAGRDFWRQLEPYPWADELVDLCQDHGFVISTSPSLGVECSAGKVAWMKSVFGPHFNDYMIGSKKYLLAQPGAILIDDADYQVRRFKIHGGEAILFPQPWNENRALIDERIDFLKEELARKGGL